MLFWDTVVLSGYLGLNLVIGFITLESERKSIAPPKWIKPLIYLSIPWAVSIHTVTAFLYSGLAARPFWLSAIMAPRFLATAFSAGPALLILLSFILRRYANYNVGKSAIQKLGTIVTYAMILNVFFLVLEFFTAFYSNIPEHTTHFKYLYVGLDGKTALVPFMWFSTTLAIISIILLINPKWRNNEKLLGIACVALFLSIWIDKGLGMIVTGFIPSVLGHVVEYLPTLPELMISLGIYAIGALCVTLLYKIALSVKEEAAK
jgi:Ni/Fe-hydrogenase subunit HybB-like protein